MQQKILQRNLGIKINGRLGSVWYVCLKTENYCLKTFVEIRMGEKVY